MRTIQNYCRAHAWSLLFGLASSTLLTVLVIPALYIVLRYRPANEDKNVPA